MFSFNASNCPCIMRTSMISSSLLQLLSSSSVCFFAIVRLLLSKLILSEKGKQCESMNHAFSSFCLFIQSCIVPINTKKYRVFKVQKYIFKTCDSANNALQPLPKIAPTDKNSLWKNRLKNLCFSQKLLCMLRMNLFDFRVQRI